MADEPIVPIDDFSFSPETVQSHARFLARVAMGEAGSFAGRAAPKNFQDIHEEKEKQKTYFESLLLLSPKELDLAVKKNAMDFQQAHAEYEGALKFYKSHNIIAVSFNCGKVGADAPVYLDNKGAYYFIDDHGQQRTLDTSQTDFVNAQRALGKKTVNDWVGNDPLRASRALSAQDNLTQKTLPMLDSGTRLTISAEAQEQKRDIAMDDIKAGDDHAFKGRTRCASDLYLPPEGGGSKLSPNRLSQKFNDLNPAAQPEAPQYRLSNKFEVTIKAGP